jgi:hypothetical protein
MEMPPTWDITRRNDVILSSVVIPHPPSIHVHSSIRLIEPVIPRPPTVDSSTPQGQGCFCNSSPCQQIGFTIFTDSSQTIHISPTDPLGGPYVIPIDIHPGTTTLAWCKNTLFHHPGQGHTHISSISIVIPAPSLTPLIHNLTPSLSFVGPYLPSPSTNVTPHQLESPADEDEIALIPSVVTLFHDVPPLWCLCRLAMGLQGVGVGGMDGADDFSGRVSNELWCHNKFILGHAYSSIH